MINNYYHAIIQYKNYISDKEIIFFSVKKNIFLLNFISVNNNHFFFN